MDCLRVRFVMSSACYAAECRQASQVAQGRYFVYIATGLTGMSFGDVFVVSVELMRSRAAPGCPLVDTVGGGG